MSNNFSPGSINLSQRSHQIIQIIIVKNGGVKKNFMKSFLVMSGNFVPGYTNVSQRVLEIITKTEIFQNFKSVKNAKNLFFLGFSESEGHETWRNAKKNFDFWTDYYIFRSIELLF